jgi:UDP-glucose 4-epimerase
MLDMAVAAGVRRVVFLSSGGTVYGIPEKIPTLESEPTEPISSYGIVKLTIEKYLKLYSQIADLDFTIIRAGNPYGPGQVGNRNQGFIGTLLASHFSNKEMEIWGDGSIVRDFIYIDDLVDAIIRAGKVEKRALTLNIGGGSGHSLNEIIQITERILGGAIDVKFLQSRSVDIQHSILNVDAAEAYRGWTPATPLEVGLKKTIEWFQHLPI